MSLFTLSILTPEHTFFTGEVQRLVVRTSEGDLGILARHEKYVAALPEGPMRIVMEDGSVRLAAISGGMLKVSPDHTAILANAVEWAEDIDMERVLSEKAKAEDWLVKHEDDGDPNDVLKAQIAISKAITRSHVAQGSHRHGR